MTAVKIQEESLEREESNQKFLFPDKPGGIVNVPHYLIRSLPADEQILLYYFASRMNAERICWPSNTLIAKELKWSIDKVNRNKKRLVTKGLLEIIPTFNKSNPGQTSNRYRIPKHTHVQNYMGASKGSDQSKLPMRSAHRSLAEHGKPDMHADGGAPVVDEVLNNLEVLPRQEFNREEYLIENHKREIFKTLVVCVFKTLDSWYGHNESATAKKIEEKLWGAATRLHDHYKTKEGAELPKYRDEGFTGSSTVSIWKEPVDQIKAYTDFSRLKNWQLSTNPETIDEKIVAKDWCEMLFNAFGGDVDEYDPAYDDELLSYWLLEVHYFDVIAHDCKNYSDRIVVDGLEYLLSDEGRKKRAEFLKNNTPTPGQLSIPTNQIQP